MALIYYETGIRTTAADGETDYINVFITQDEEAARREFQTDRRNYLARLIFEETGTVTQFYNQETGVWEHKA